MTMGQILIGEATINSWMQTCTSTDIRKCALVIATLTSFLPPFMASSINIALPAIGAEFSMNAILLGWIATSYLLSAAVFMVPFGKLADIYGMKKVFFIGLFIFTASSLVAFFAPTSAILIGSRILQGIGSAMIFGTGTAILVNVFPLQERGKVLGNQCRLRLPGPLVGAFPGRPAHPVLRLEKPLSDQCSPGTDSACSGAVEAERRMGRSQRGKDSILWDRQSTA